MIGNDHAPFGRGSSEKDPNHGHLAGGLLHSGGGRREQDHTSGTSPDGLPRGYGLSYREVEELLAKRGITVDHVTIYR